MNESINQLINDGGDCRTAPATPALLITRVKEEPTILQLYYKKVTYNL